MYVRSSERAFLSCSSKVDDYKTRRRNETAGYMLRRWRISRRGARDEAVWNFSFTSVYRSRARTREKRERNCISPLFSLLPESRCWIPVLELHCFDLGTRGSSSQSLALPHFRIECTLRRVSGELITTYARNQQDIGILPNQECWIATKYF